jgi:hypothetical protein
VRRVRREFPGGVEKSITDVRRCHDVAGDGHTKHAIAAGLDDEIMLTSFTGFAGDDVLHPAITTIPTCYTYMPMPVSISAFIDDQRPLPCNGTPSVENIIASHPGSNSTRIYFSDDLTMEENEARTLNTFILQPVMWDDEGDFKPVVGLK